MLAQPHCGIRFITDDEIRNLDILATQEREWKPMTKEERHAQFGGIDYLVNKDKTGGNITWAAKSQPAYPTALASKRAAWELAEDEAEDNPQHPNPKHRPYSTNCRPGRRMKGYSTAVVPHPKHAKGQSKGTTKKMKKHRNRLSHRQRHSLMSHKKISCRGAAGIVAAMGAKARYLTRRTTTAVARGGPRLNGTSGTAGKVGVEPKTRRTRTHTLSFPPELFSK